MWAYHDSRDTLYRNPYGAAPVGGAVVLKLDVGGDRDASATLRTWVDGVGETFVPMVGEQLEDRVRFSVEYACEQPALVWYSFVIERGDGRVLRYGARDGKTGGEGVLCEWEPPSFQLTVYEPREVKPAWFTSGIVYQIFPDRYRRGADWRARVELAGHLHENDSADGVAGTRRNVVERWDTEPAYAKDEAGRVTTWDFYGGTLEGIRDDLPRLADMGISTLYLNPIFEARSSHRYDTADFMQVDAMLGDEQGFRDLCAQAAELGISIVLDGVFNHVGADSRYFNRYETYAEPGAWQAHTQGEKSPYADWFGWKDDGTYDAWWGVDDLPAINESNPGYQRLICGKDGVVRHWLAAGARGWRLDVADELPDEFIEQIRAAAAAERADALVLGEVWEDASNKVSYGKLRRYLLGSELDSAMNYPFRDAVLGFLLGTTSAPDAAESLASITENYPLEAQAASLNLLSSHDRPRLMSVLGGALGHPDWQPWPDDFPGRLTDGERGLAKGRFWLATLMQMTYLGVPSIYYGDELGMEGLSDPYNRGPYPWARGDAGASGEAVGELVTGDADCRTMYRNVIQLRRSLPVLTDGLVRPFAPCDDVLGWWRLPQGGEGMSACVLVNRSLSEWHDVSVEDRGARASEVIGGAELRREGGRVALTLAPLGSAVIVFDDGAGLARLLETGTGVVCHVTSVPNGGRPGTLGTPARAFVDWLEANGQRYWQILPANPTDGFGSPYAGTSVFAGNERLLAVQGGELRARMEAFEPDAVYEEFMQANAEWLDPYACYAAIAELTGTDAWQTWPERWRRYAPELLDDPRLADGIRLHRFAQWEFEWEWMDLRSYANARGVQIIGDIPMYVAANSADVWATPEQFCLNADGSASLQAGTPPDAFAKDGQLWGNPCYRWDAMRADGYDWWMRRLARTFALYDVTRLDHFLGFQNYYGVPAGKGALEGSWHEGPGIELFRRAHELLGPLPIIAEDLGSVTPATRALLAQVGCRGMDVLQFADGDVRGGWQPKAGKVAYTSTHDTQTLVGWCAERFGLGEPAARELADRLMRQTYASAADVVMCTLQDAALLGDDARMNVPGVAEGNWSWQATDELLPSAGAYLRELGAARG